MKIFNFNFSIILFYILLTVSSILTYSPYNYSLNSSYYEFNYDIFGSFGSILIDIQMQFMGLAGIMISIIFFSILLILAYLNSQPIQYKLILLIKLCIIAFLLSLCTLNQHIQVLNLGILQILVYNIFGANLLFLSIFSLLFMWTLRTIFQEMQIVSQMPIANKSILSNDYAPYIAPTKKKEEPNKQQFKYVESSFIKPRLNLLNASNDKGTTATNDELRQISKDLLRHLNDFGVKGKIIDVQQGPVMLIFEFEPEAGIKNARIINLADDISRVMSTSSIRIAPVKNKNVLGIEIPKYKRSVFNIKELLENDIFQNSDLQIPIILGYSIYGNIILKDLALAPHLLIAGTTGSGKSVGLNAIILSILYKFTPAECKLIMIDPKMLELSIYNDIPHLITPVITNPQDSITALKWVVSEMEKRYKLMMKMETRNIKSYNAKISGMIKDRNNIKQTKVQTSFDPKSGTPIYEDVPVSLEIMPYIVVFIDEFADLMLTAGRDIEVQIQRIAQKARAAGIHLIMATQRPSVNVVTGVIKANFPNRISFKVASQIDSRTILNKEGAEKLLGKGDMLFSDSSEILRAHCPFVDESEIVKVVNHLKAQEKVQYIDIISEMLEDEETHSDSDTQMSLSEDDVDLYKQAVQIVLETKKTSISFLQRRMRIGFNKAANLIEEMEKNGVLSEANDIGKRNILVSAYSNNKE